MYHFPEEIRKAYEALSTPLAFYEKRGDQFFPLLLSDGFCRLLKMNREKALRLQEFSPYDQLHPEDVGMTVSAVRRFLNHESGYDVVYRARIEDAGPYHDIHSVAHWETMPDGTELVLAQYIDLENWRTEVRQLSEDYQVFQRDHFYTDSLTGLPNINYMFQFANQRVHSIRLQERTPFLLYTDVNSMQSYNNQYGFEKGNELLCLIAKMLQQFFPDALITRGTDDHFILIDAWRSEEELSLCLASVNDQVRKSAFGATTGIQAGICLYTDTMQTGEAVDHAKNALKRVGSDLNQLYRVYSRRADDEYWNQRYIIENLDRALDESWIRVFYQGILDLKQNQTATLEALARWNDPVRGTISPGEFIPVLEKYHLLYRLDLFMVKQVLREFQKRKEAGMPLLPVSINFSAQDFDYVDIPAEIESLYQDSGASRLIPRSYLILEITEQDMATATDRFHEQLSILRQMGYPLWLDDFGSGYSSLNVFSRFDVDLMKFDMALVQHLDDHGGINRDILRSMVSIARSRGIKTLAEGMETESQKEFLRQIGIDYAQGFLYRKPEPLEVFLYRKERQAYAQP